MDKNLIEQYKQEMLRMYRGSGARVVQSTVNNIPTRSAEPQILQNTAANDQMLSSADTGSGKLIAVVTTLRNLYPVNRAKVTVFKGDIDNMEIIATDFTDQSGRTDAFTLSAPEKSLSMESSNTKVPYATYNMLVQAEGYRDNIHINIPVFSTVTSIQPSNMMLLETAGVDKGPQIFDEIQQFNLQQ